MIRLRRTFFFHLWVTNADGVSNRRRSISFCVYYSCCLSVGCQTAIAFGKSCVIILLCERGYGRTCSPYLSSCRVGKSGQGGTGSFFAAGFFLLSQDAAFSSGRTIQFIPNPSRANCPSNHLRRRPRRSRVVVVSLFHPSDCQMARMTSWYYYRNPHRHLKGCNWKNCGNFPRG